MVRRGEAVRRWKFAVDVLVGVGVWVMIGGAACRLATRDPVRHETGTQRA
jgi:hypothetical protein